MKDVAIERIKKMEKILDKNKKILEKLTTALNEFKGAEKEYKELLDYYYSDEHAKDVDDSNAGLFPNDLKCGVLSEDCVYDLIRGNYDASIEMLEIAVSRIKNY